MSDKPDPERLLAEALRAQAVRAPVPAGGVQQADVPVTDPLPAPVAGPAVGPDRQPDDDDGPVPVPERDTARLAGSASLSVWWIVTLALLLGLASGAVVGLVSVL